jgi:hypothetical protein
MEAKAKRPTVEVACAACHKGKKKCDGTLPCSRCVKLGRECIAHVPRKRGPPPGKKVNRESGDFAKAPQSWELSVVSARGAQPGVESTWEMRSGDALVWKVDVAPSPAMLGLLLRYASAAMVVERPVALASSLGVNVGPNFIAVEFPPPQPHVPLSEWCRGAHVLSCRSDGTIPQLESCDYYVDKRLADFCERDERMDAIIEQGMMAISAVAAPHLRNIQMQKVLFSRNAKRVHAHLRMTMVVDEHGAPRYGFASVLSAADSDDSLERDESGDSSVGAPWANLLDSFDPDPFDFDSLVGVGPLYV